MYRLRTVSAPVDADRFTVDVAALRDLALEHRPRMITIGASMNLYPHPVAALREVADEVGAVLLFDAAHVCGLIAGGAWPNPLEQGAHVMTMSTYKSLGGPPGGLVVTNEAEIARSLDAIAYPGLTANFDAGKAAALAVTMLDWKAAGADYAATMVQTAAALAAGLVERGLPVFQGIDGPTGSHQLALEARQWGGGQSAARLLRRANLLTSGIGLPVEAVDGDMNGLRIGTPELVRLGMGPGDMDVLASLLAEALAPEPISTTRHPGDGVAVPLRRGALHRLGRGVRHPADAVALAGVPLLPRGALLRPGEVEVVGGVRRDVAADLVHPLGDRVAGGQRAARDVDGRDRTPRVLGAARHPPEPGGAGCRGGAHQRAVPALRLPREPQQRAG